MRNIIRQYYVAYERDESGGYIASVPAIPGCVVYGKTIYEAYQNIQSAIQECLEVIQESNKPTPKESINPEIIRKFSFVTPKEYAKT